VARLTHRLVELAWLAQFGNDVLGQCDFRGVLHAEDRPACFLGACQPAFDARIDPECGHRVDR
jgi:hypothetical protein